MNARQPEGRRTRRDRVPRPEEPMSKINGEKARAAIAKKRRTAQREKDRVARAAATTKTADTKAKS